MALVESGKVGADDLRAFEELQKDLKALESYAGAEGVSRLDYPAQEHSRFRPMALPVQMAPTGELMAEVVELKMLFHYCAAGLAAALILLVGYVWFKRRHARYLEDYVDNLPMLPRQTSGSSH